MTARPLVWCVAAVATAALASPARADLTFYTTESSFLAALQATRFTDTYNDLPGNLVNSPINRSGNGYGYTASAANNFFPAGTAGDRWLSTNNANDPIVHGSFTGGPTAIGGFFFTSNSAGSAATGSISLSLVAGTDTDTRTLTNTTPNTFFGWVSTNAITSLSVASVKPTSGNLWPTVNNLTIGQGVAAVPEPSGMALTLLGMPALALVRRLRRAEAA